MCAQIRPGGSMPMHCFPEVDRVLQQGRRENAVLDDLLVVIQIIDETIECDHALFQAFLYLHPVRLGNNARNDVEWPGAVNRTFLFRIDGKCHAHELDRHFRGDLVFLDFPVAEIAQILAKGGGCITGLARYTNKFVIKPLCLVTTPADCHNSVAAWCQIGLR